MRGTSTRVSNTSPFAAYGQAAQTVAKTQQVVMLYDGAIRFLRQAKEAAQDKRIEARYKLLVRTSEIVMGLQSSLDFETGGDIARMLYDFYASVDARIMNLHRTPSAEAYDELMRELKEMRDAWAKIDKTDSPGSPAVSSAVVPQAAVQLPASATAGLKVGETGSSPSAPAPAAPVAAAAMRATLSSSAEGLTLSA